MTDRETLHWAHAKPEYSVTPMRNEQNEVAPHYLNELEEHGLDFDELMAHDARFAEIIDNEIAAESHAGADLAILAQAAPDDCSRNLFLRWLAFINADLQPWTTGGAIHFRPHWARVLLLALTLGRKRNLASPDLEALAMAAVFHDTRRKDPYLDTGHGARAARYYAAFCLDEGKGAARRSPAGRSIRFDPRTYLAIYWHDRADEDGLAAIETSLRANSLPDLGIEDMSALVPAEAQADFSLLYLMFKDADALDRVRLGPHDLDPSFLRTEESHELLPFAQHLFALSAQPQ